jgi:hypothetical protein
MAHQGVADGPTLPSKRKRVDLLLVVDSRVFGIDCLGHSHCLNLPPTFADNNRWLIAFGALTKVQVARPAS